MNRTTLAFHPLSFVRMIWKRKALVCALWVLLSGAGAGVIRTVPDTYRAEALILVDSQKIPERFVASTVQVSPQEHLAAISQRILSGTELEKLIEKFRLYPELRRDLAPERVIEKMRADIEITPEKGWGAPRSSNAAIGAFRIAYEGPSAVVVAGVVNEIAGLFIAENLRSREQRAEGTSAFLESQLQEARKSLEQQESNLSRFKMGRMGELPQQEAALIATLNRLHLELQGNQDAANRAEQNKLMLENTLRMAEAAEAALQRNLQPPASPRKTAAMAEDGAQPAAPGTPAPMRSQVLEARLAALRVRYQEEHPEVRRLKTELEEVRRMEAEEAPKPAAPEGRRTAAAPPPAPAPTPDPLAAGELRRERERVATAKTQLAIAVRELEAHVADRKRILRSIADYQSKLERLPVREQELSAVTRDYEISKQNYQSLLDKRKSADMATEMERRQQAERFTIQDPARVPGAPVRPKRMMLNLGAVGLGLALSLALAIGLEFQKHRFLGEWELPAKITVLGRVPPIVIGEPGPAAGPARETGS